MEYFASQKVENYLFCHLLHKTSNMLKLKVLGVYLVS